MKEYPILSPESERAAQAAIGAKAQGKYWPVHQGLMAVQTLDDASISQVLAESGVDVERALKDGASAASAKQLEETHALARAVAVAGTPAFVIGDVMVAGWDQPKIAKAIADARKAS